jgi:hypothetical protein
MISAALLPETLNQHLPESIEAANDFGKDHGFWSFRPKRAARKLRFVPVSSIRRLHSSGKERRGSARRESVVAYVSQVHPSSFRARSGSTIAFGITAHV